MSAARCAVAVHLRLKLVPPMCWFRLHIRRDEEATTPIRGHITSLAVLRTHRKLGLATKLMLAARE